MLNDALAALFFFVLAVIGWATNVIWLVYLYVQTHSLDLGILAFVMALAFGGVIWNERRIERRNADLADDDEI